MKRFAADVWWVAVYELGEAVRTRLFQLVLLAYCGGIAGSTWVLVRILRRLEASVAEPLGVPATDRPGALMGALQADGKLADLVGGLVDSDTDITALLDEPLVAVWTGATSMGLLPLVLVFSASASIAAEVKSRSVRYLLCRTGRLQIGLGKLAGQLLVAVVAALLGAAVAWVLGMTLMVGNPPVEMAVALVGRTLRAVAWALPFAGLGLAASQWVANPNGARVLAAGLLFGMPIADGLLFTASGTDFLGRLADLGGMFLATSLWADFWTPDLGLLGATVVKALVLAVIYFASGYAVFTRRDL